MTPVEAAVGVAIAGSLIATAIPTFVKNLHASRLVEPVEGLEHIATRATALAAGRVPEAAYPDSVELTPSRVPAGEPATDPPGTWSHPTWQLLEFGWDVPHSYSFAFESRNSPSLATFRATAHGDLDGDGVLSTFSISGRFKAGAEPTTTHLVIRREVE